MTSNLRDLYEEWLLSQSPPPTQECSVASEEKLGRSLEERCIPLLEVRGPEALLRTTFDCIDVDWIDCYAVRIARIVP